MQKFPLIVAGVAVVFTLSQAPAMSQTGAPPNAATVITQEEINTVNKSPGTDRQLTIVDMGKYNLAVGIIHRGATAPAAAAARGAASPAAAAARSGPPPVRCGATGTSTSTVSGIAHDATAETYIIVSGGGTVVTGGTIVNGTRSGPESDVTRILNGPSCSGRMEGDLVRRVVKPGDVVIIPANVPHGWIDITDHVDYLSVRPDPDKVLQSGYVHPLLKK